MYCGKCGNKMPDKETICPKCGADMALPPGSKKRQALPAGERPGFFRRFMDKLSGK